MPSVAPHELGIDGRRWREVSRRAEASMNSRSIALVLSLSTAACSEMSALDDATERTQQGLVQQVSYTFQNGVDAYQGCEDTYLQENSSTNFGSSAQLLLDGSPTDLYSLIRCNLASIPPGTTVESATLSLTVFDVSTNSYSVHPLLRDWVQAGANWQRFAVGSNWQTAGAKGSQDRGASFGSISASQLGEYQLSLPISLVQQWVDEPASNRGLLMQSTSSSNGVDFRSSEYSTVSQRPKLTVTGYIELPDPEPEPVASGGAGAGGSASGGNGSGAQGGSTQGSGAQGSGAQGGSAQGGSGNGPTPAPAPTAVQLWALGDMADAAVTTDTAVGNLFDGDQHRILALGDTQYPDGREYYNVFHDPFGRHVHRVLPVVGNHEYESGNNAIGYSNYFGASAGRPNELWYSFRYGGWLIVVVNTACNNATEACAPSATQVNWFTTTLANNSSGSNLPVLVASHHPRWSSGLHRDQPNVQSLWAVAANAGACLWLSGHDHTVEWFFPKNASGSVVERGLRQFVSGVGGDSLRDFTSTSSGSEARFGQSSGVTYGALLFTLRSDRTYSWTFRGIAGSTPAQALVAGGSDTCP